MFREINTFRRLRGEEVQRHVRLVLVACAISSTLLWCSWCFAQQDQPEIKRKVVNKVAPLYPELAHRMMISGTVKLEIVVAPNGFPKSEKILGGHPLLGQSATDAVRKWKWAPNPQETTELIEIKFDLKE
jgi:TonB family protein